MLNICLVISAQLIILCGMFRTSDKYMYKKEKLCVFVCLCLCFFCVLLFCTFVAYVWLRVWVVGGCGGAWEGGGMVCVPNVDSAFTVAIRPNYEKILNNFLLNHFKYH